jgi:uncharacterized repeat protein (TIGR02543 family)
VDERYDTAGTGLSVAYGTSPSYDSATPTKAATAQYTYTFIGWNTDPTATTGTLEANLSSVTGDVTYYAIFSETTNEYTVTWMNDTTTLETDSDVAYGTSPSYDSATPTKAATAQYTYTFIGWNTDPTATTGTLEANLPSVTGDVTYYAIFSETTNEYTVTWMNGTSELKKIRAFFTEPHRAMTAMNQQKQRQRSTLIRYRMEHGSDGNDGNFGSKPFERNRRCNVLCDLQRNDERIHGNVDERYDDTGDGQRCSIRNITEL